LFSPTGGTGAAVNKWLVAHPDAMIGGTFNGIKGENLSV